VVALYLYAITDRPEAALPVLSGVENAPVFQLGYRDLAAVASRTASCDVPATETHLWQHEAVVEALMADRTALPVRFGSVLPGEAALWDALAAVHAELVAALGRVRGRVEVGVRVLWDDGCQPATSRDESEQTSGQPAGSGRFYLMARLEQEQRSQAGRQRAESMANRIHAPLARLAAANTRQVLATPHLLLTAAYLIEKDRLEAFESEVRALGAAYPALHLLATGPWPPYSFVTGLARLSGPG
jgi:hypothetical protein